MEYTIELPPNIVDAFTTGLFLIPLLIGIVQRLKETFPKLKNRILPIAILLGVVAGIEYLIVFYGVISPMTFYVGAGYGLVLGLAASGLFDVGKYFSDRAFSGKVHRFQPFNTTLELRVSDEGEDYAYIAGE